MTKRFLYGVFLTLVALGLVFILEVKGSHLHEVPVAYQVPDVNLVNQRGQVVPLQSYLSADLPVMLMFGFTSCVTLCPEQSVLFANLQQRLADSRQVRLVTISVDPETDRPEVLNAYLKKFDARPGWDFLTGTQQDIGRVMQAFDYHPTDMVTRKSALLLRPAGSQEWIRIDGELDGKIVRDRYRQLAR